MEDSLTALVKEDPETPEVDSGSNPILNPGKYFINNFVDAHYNHILRYALVLTKNLEDAKDLTQTAYEKAWQAFSKKPSNAFFPFAWLKTIARNTFFNEYRRKKRGIVTEEIDENNTGVIYHPDPFHGITVDDIAASDAKMNELEELMFGEEIEKVRGIHPQLRRTYYMFVLFDLNCNEINEMTGIPIGTVTSRVYRAARNLRKVVNLY
jgi:RNA polymerase sigma-70 factor (ECF subfamily)